MSRPMILVVPVDGERTRMRDTGGDKPALVFVHGLANSVGIWDRVVLGLAERFPGIAFDLPGFGAASRPDAVYDAAFFADQMLAVLDTLGLPRAHLVGSSLGASVIVRLSDRALERIDRVVLAAPDGFGRRTHQRR